MGTHAFFDQLDPLDVGVGGWVDCSQMSTAAAVNAAAAAAGAGAVIWLGPRPAGEELVIEDTLIYYPNQYWLGAGGRSGNTRIVAGPSFPAGEPMMAALGYMTNQPDADEGIKLEGFVLDMNEKAGSHGLVVWNFWSHCEDLQFWGCNGGDCVRLTDRAYDGVTISSNSHSENTFDYLRFDETINGGRHFYQESNNNNSNQDGHLSNSFFAGADGACIELRRAAGWTVQNNHLYGVGDDAIIALLCYGTKILNNYIEDFGRNGVNTSPANGYYTAIGMSILNGKPSLCFGNTVSFVTPTGGSTYVRLAGISARAGSGQTRARINIENNILAMSGASETITNSEAIRIGEAGDTGRLLEFSLSGNTISQRGEFTTQIFRSNSTTRMVKDAPGIRSYTGVTGTHTLDNQHEMVQNLTVTGAVEIDPPATNTYARDGEPFQLTFLASGGARAITFDASIRLSTGLSSRTFNVPNGEVLRAAIEWSSLVNDYIITAATVSAN